MLSARSAGRARVWVIANGHVSRDAALRSDAANTLTLARRGVSELIRQLLYSSVREAEQKATQAGARFQLIALPDSVPEAVDPFQFQPTEMKSLFETGRAIGAQRFGPLLRI